MKRNIAALLFTVAFVFGINTLTRAERIVIYYSLPENDTIKKKAPDNWFNLDMTKDKVFGVSTEETYKKLLAGKKSKTVIVAVIDSGVDINHEDLKGLIWVNEDEIPGNNKDDDNNGYVDDINGWNFIGGPNGNVHHETLELTRLYAYYSEKYGDKPATQAADKKDFARWQQVKEAFETKLEEATMEAEGFMGFYAPIKEAKELLSKAMGKEEFTTAELEKFEPKDDATKEAKETMMTVLGRGIELKDLKRGEEYYMGQLEYNLNPEYDVRSIVGDDYDNSNERGYGNNDVMGPDASHGTHVAGIIGANRTNNKGMMGVADNVKIMSIRAVPDGDERDKDVANAIRYAVDNGAQVVNMSFGKGWSWDKAVVDEAVKYAESKGVLLVHAAGNDNKNTDVETNFPNAYYNDNKKKRAKNWLEVGAFSYKKDEMCVAPFSNYGKEKVDLFSPGVDIYSTTPGSKYDEFSGTSMAAPVTAGIAALILSYYPELTGIQVKEILTKSVVNIGDREVVKPGNEKGDPKVKFNTLSNTGGVVNAYKAMELAAKTKPKKAPKAKGKV